MAPGRGPGAVSKVSEVLLDPSGRPHASGGDLAGAGLNRRPRRVLIWQRLYGQHAAARCGRLGSRENTPVLVSKFAGPVLN